MCGVIPGRFGRQLALLYEEWGKAAQTNIGTVSAATIATLGRAARSTWVKPSRTQ